MIIELSSPLCDLMHLQLHNLKGGGLDLKRRKEGGSIFNICYIIGKDDQVENFCLTSFAWNATIGSRNFYSGWYVSAQISVLWIFQPLRQTHFRLECPTPTPGPHLFSLHRIMYGTAPVTQFLSRGHDRWATNRYVSSTSQLIHMLTYGLW